MGILDDLKAKREAEEQRLASEEEKRRKHQVFYEQHINPRLKKLYTYLSELSDHLNYLKPDNSFSYAFPTVGDIEDFTQENYRLSVDSADLMKRLNLRFQCTRDPYSIALEPGTPADKLLDFLKARHIDHQARRVRASAVSHWHLDIAFDCLVHAGVEFEANLETLTIDMTAINFPTWGRRSLRYKPHEIDEDFFDELGRFLLREESRLLSLTMSDEDRERIRKITEQEKKRRRRENILARQYTPNPEQKRSETPSLLDRLKPRKR